MASIDTLPNAAAFATRRPRLARLIGNVLDGPGVTDTSLRQAAALGGNVPGELRSYLQKVNRHAYRIADEDIASLKAAGHGEDAILEVSIAAAVGAALLRLEKGLGAAQPPTASRGST